MIFYQNYIQNCIINYIPCENGTCFDTECDCHCREKKSCTDCLSDMFNNDEHAKRVYKCIPITFSYVIRFSNRYASEILTALRCKIVKNVIQNIDEIKVLSIGCGPATELVALEMFSMEEGKQVKFYGYDPNNIWENVQKTLQNSLIGTNCVAEFNCSDFQENNEILPEIDILILNYIVSDIYKHNKDNVEKFFENFSKIVKKMKKNSIIIINDVNSCNMGRDEIEEWGKKIENNDFFIASAYFNYPDRYRNQKFSKFRYIHEFPNTPLLFDTSSILGIDRFVDNVSECRSAFVIIKKIGRCSS